MFSIVRTSELKELKELVEELDDRIYELEVSAYVAVGAGPKMVSANNVAESCRVNDVVRLLLNSLELQVKYANNKYSLTKKSAKK